MEKMQSMIAEVIVNSKSNELNRTFDYGVPENLDVTLRYACINSVWSKKNL